MEKEEIIQIEKGTDEEFISRCCGAITYALVCCCCSLCGKDASDG